MRWGLAEGGICSILEHMGSVDKQKLFRRLQRIRESEMLK